MTEKHTTGEAHGCIVCGTLYQLYVVHDGAGNFVDAKVMTPGGRIVQHAERPLVACERHSPDEIKAAVARAYGKRRDDLE